MEGLLSELQLSSHTYVGTHQYWRKKPDTCFPWIRPKLPSTVYNTTTINLPGDIQKIAEAVRNAVKDFLREEFARILDEKTAPLHAATDQFRSDNKDLRRQLDELEQYGRRPLIRLSGIRETTGQDTSALILQVTKTAGIALDQQDIVTSHRVGKPANRRQSPRQIIAGLKSVDTKFHILRNSKKFQENDQTKGISVNEDLTKVRDRLLFHCRQLCCQRRIKKVWTSYGKITVKDHDDRNHHVRDEANLVKFGNVMQAD